MEVMCSSSYSYSAYGNMEYPGNFQNKSVNSSFNGVSIHIYSLLAQTEEERKAFFGGLEGAERETTLCHYPQEHLVVMTDEKVSPFVKLEIILHLLCFLLDPLINKPCRTWSSMINLWLDSRTCQK